jgi:hypothetical protein
MNNKNLCFLFTIVVIASIVSSRIQTAGGQVRVMDIKIPNAV